jgi:TrmH family RNA methyltransferase
MKLVCKPGMNSLFLQTNSNSIHVYKRKSMLVKSQVKYIQSLGHKKHRDEEGAFIAEGPKLVKELLNAPHVPLLNLFAVREWIEMNQSRVAENQLIELSESELERISFLTTPNQVVGIFKKPSFPEMDIKGKITLMLDNIQDPGNLGTIVRIADWFGVERIVCSEDSADVFNPKVVQATMGSISRVHVSYIGLEDFLSLHPGIAVYATTLDGVVMPAMTPIKEGIIVIGNESKGIHDELLKMIEHRITIPKKGKAESLNAAVATGIILSHVV